MGNGVSGNQGNFPSHGKRDVSDAPDRKRHDWLEQAEAPNANTPSEVVKSCSGASNVGLKSEHIGTTYSGTQLRGRKLEDDTRSGAPYSVARAWGRKLSTDDDTQFGAYSGAQLRDRKSLLESTEEQDDTRPDAYSNVSNQQDRKSWVMKDDVQLDSSSGVQTQHRKSSVMKDDTQLGVFSDKGLRNRKLPTTARKNSSSDEDGNLKTEERRQKKEERRLEVLCKLNRTRVRPHTLQGGRRPEVLCKLNHVTHGPPDSDRVHSNRK